MACGLRATVLLMFAFLVGCASATVIHTTPEGARVFANGQELGVTPYTYSDKRVAGTSVELMFMKKGFEPYTVRMTRDEEFNTGACLGGAFLLVPFLWILDYRAEHHWDLPPRSRPLREMDFPGSPDGKKKEFSPKPKKRNSKKPVKNQ